MPNLRSLAQVSGKFGEIEWFVIKAPEYINDSAYNEYVSLPEDHPYYTLGYDDIRDWSGQELTYSENGIFGFDCLHSGDSWPNSTWYVGSGSEMVDSSAGFGSPRRIWSLDLVVEEAMSLASFMNDAYKKE